MAVPQADQQRLRAILAFDLQPRIQWAYDLEQQISILSGGGLTSWGLASEAEFRGNGDPNGVVTAAAIGDLYIDDSGTPSYWIANGAGTVWTELAASGGGGGAPTDATYLVATANGDLTAEVVVGATPGGELGGTWPSPTVDTTHSGSSHASVQAAAEATAANATNLTSGTVNIARLPIDADVATLSLPASTTITTFGASLVDDADAAAGRATLGLGTIATQNANNVTISGGAITGITDLAIADGGTGASTAPAAVANLFPRTTFSNANYTVLTTDSYVAQTGTMSAARTATLPAANTVAAGKSIVIADESGTVTSTNTIIIARAGADTINGGTSVSLTNAYGVREFFSDGTSKWTTRITGLTAGGTGATTAAGAIANLGLDADLATFALPASTTITAAGAALIDDADASAQRTTLGLGTIATQAETAYALLAGRSAGQTLIGDTLTGGSLVLQSTAHATRGFVKIGTSSAFDEVNLRLGIGTQAPTAIVHAFPQTPASVGTSPGTAAADILRGAGGAGPTGGLTTIATTGTGGVGANYSFTGSPGGTALSAVTSSTGGKGGGITIITGAGAVGGATAGSTTAVGGAAGDVNATGGIGGAVSSANATATGGVGGQILYIAGAGGAESNSTSAGTGGQGGQVSFTAGAGGASATGAGTHTGGAGGTITFAAGAGGTGTTANGTPGTIIFKVSGGTGAAATVLTISNNGTNPLLTLADAVNIVLNTTTGTKIGTATTQKLGFYNATPVVQQTDGAALTNNVTAGGTNNTIDNYTDLVIYANDAAAIRNAIYQLARKQKVIGDALRAYGLLS